MTQLTSAKSQAAEAAASKFDRAPPAVNLRAKAGPPNMDYDPVGTVVSALDTQVGGDHYSRMKIQPIEFIQGNDLEFCVANIVKYACRHRFKNGKQDLLKIKHYVDLIIENEYPEKPDPD